MREGLDALFFGALSDEQEVDLGMSVADLFGGGEKSFEAVRHAHGADVADKIPGFDSELAARGCDGVFGCGSEEIGFDSVFDDGDFFGGDAPTFD